MNKRKDFTLKKEIDEARRRKANIEKVGKIIFWFYRIMKSRSKRTY